MFNHIELETDKPIARLRFNRAAKKNSMINEMGLEVKEAVERINKNDSIRVVILSGNGDVFSSGGDLNMITELSKVSMEESKAFMGTYYRNYFSIQKIQVPTIAMINGHAIGAGLCISLACDLRTVVVDAKLGVTFVKVGLNAGMGATYTLPRIIGLGRALDLLLTGRLISAEEALHMGLVNYIFSRDELEQETLRIAKIIADNAPLAVRYTKRSTMQGLSSTLEEGFDLEADGQSYCYKSSDILEGVSAVKEKRKPVFSGN